MKQPTKALPKKYIEKFGHRAIDEYTRDMNNEYGYPLCEHCGGTGNEMYSMYRCCPDCGGSGRA